jgi:hypothetical protein
MDIEINVERLREGLVDHYGTAMTGGQWPAIADLSEVENASPEKLIRLAEREGIDLRKYEAR